MKTHKNYEQIICSLSNTEDTEILKSLILKLKRDEIFIDRRGENKFQEIISRITPKTSVVKEYINEIELINLIFTQEKNLQDEILKIPAKYRFAYIWMGFNNEYKLARYDLISRTQSINKNNDDVLAMQGFVEVFIETFKSLTYHTDICEDMNFLYLPFTIKCKDEWITLMQNFMNNAVITLKWEKLYHAWKHGLVKVSSSIEGVDIKYIKNNNYKWITRSLSKAEVYKRIEEYTKYVKIIAQDENISYGGQEFLNLLSNYHINDLIHKYCNGSEMFSGITITDWIKGYTALNLFCRKWYKTNNLKDFTYKKYLKSKKVFLNTKKYWLNILVEGGVSMLNSEALFNKLIYLKGSTDILDFPFIKVKNKYLIAHNLMNDADLGYVLESRLKQNDANLHERGKNFETLIISELRNVNIKAVRLHRKVGNKEYECDVAFIINDVLFLCECKDNGINELVNWNHSFYEKDITQANRIFDYFENDLDYVKQCFLSDGVEAKNINFIAKFLIYNTSLYGVQESNGTKVLDYEQFISPFRRNYLDKQICKKSNGPMECMEGPITAKKIFKYHKAKINFLDFDNLFYTQEASFKFGNLNLTIDEYLFKSVTEQQIVDIVLPTN